MFFFDFQYLLFVAPAILLGLWAQSRVRSTYSEAMREPAPLSGARAARAILDDAGLNHVAVEETEGTLSDHYDPRDKTLRLSSEVFHSYSLAAVGIAAHEAGHAIQDARAYAPLVIRNAAVPLAHFGGNVSLLLILAGLFFAQWLVWAGIIAFTCVVAFQLVNLPVEFDASRRAKLELAHMGIVNAHEAIWVNKVLNAAALTYVAGTLQSVLTLLYLVSRFGGGHDD